MKNKFFTFIAPYLNFIDRGDMFRKPFSWLYAILAIINLLVPFITLFWAIEKQIFEYGESKVLMTFFFVWIVITFASWVSFQLWWDRRIKVTQTTIEGDEFIATPVFSHYIQTLGEWIGTWVGIVGTAVALSFTIIMGDVGNYFLENLDIPFFEAGIASIILMPIYGFLIIVFGRFLAETFRALSSIANNTKKI
jgi:hypothetical protein